MRNFTLNAVVTVTKADNVEDKFREFFEEALSGGRIPEGSIFLRVENLNYCEDNQVFGDILYDAP